MLQSFIVSVLHGSGDRGLVLGATTDSTNDVPVLAVDQGCKSRPAAVSILTHRYQHCI